jgi:nucleoid-associated protein YgaU
MGNKPSVSVVSQVKEFLGICYKEDKVTPRFLKITWGESIFDCVLQSSDIKYSLFDQSGTPLRATITATFLVENMGEVITEEGDKSKVNKQHVVKKGDSLPMIAVATYGSVAFLLPLARYNGVKHLREIKSGTTLDLPAVDVLKKLV